MSKTSKLSSLAILAAGFIALAFGAGGCNNQQPAQTDQSQETAQPAATDQSQDPAAAANLAPTDQDANNSGNDNDNNYDADYQDTSYGQPVLQAQQAPPPLPEYSQPECPGNGYLWTPGYWSYAPQGYYWVPGAWARPPQVGFLWTPGYWGFTGGLYRYNYGFWGRISATTAALTMDSATSASAIRAGTGTEIVSTTTVPSTM